MAKLPYFIGQRFPLHATSPGKVLLTSWPGARLEYYLSQPLQRFTAKSITDPNVLRQQLADIQEKGYAWVVEELDETAGVSVPIQYQNDIVIAAINHYGPSFRFPPEGQKEGITRLVVETMCSGKSAIIGCRPT